MNLDEFISNKYTQGVLIGSFLYNFREIYGSIMKKLQEM